MSNTNHDVAHIWAAHNMGTTERSHARSSNGNFSFDGPSLYSYSTEIARIMRAPGGTRWALFNTARFSVTTTGKHYNARNGALRGLDGVRIINRNQPERSRPLMPTRNGEPWGDDIERIAMELVEREQFGDAQFLGELYGFTIEGVQEMAERARARSEGLAIWRHIVNFLGDYKRAAGEVYERPLRALADISRGLEWLAGSRYHGLNRPTFPTLLRVNGDTVETSRGAEFPLEHGLRALPFIDRAKRGGGIEMASTVNGGWRLGHFRIDRVEADGTVVAGCHRVPEFAVRWAACQSGAHALAPDLEHVAQAVNAIRASSHLAAPNE